MTAGQSVAIERGVEPPRDCLNRGMPVALEVPGSGSRFARTGPTTFAPQDAAERGTRMYHNGLLRLGGAFVVAAACAAARADAPHSLRPAEPRAVDVERRLAELERELSATRAELAEQRAEFRRQEAAGQRPVGVAAAAVSAQGGLSSAADACPPGAKLSEGMIVGSDM